MAITSFRKGASTRLSGGALIANFTATPTGSYVENGISYKYLRFNSSSTITFVQSGIADILVVGGGGSGVYNDNGVCGGGGGAVKFGTFIVDAATYTVTVGAAGGVSSFGNILKSGQGAGGSAFRPDGGYYSFEGHSGGGGGGALSLRTTIGWPNIAGGGAGGTANGSFVYSGIVNSYTGTATEYGMGGYPGVGAGGANTGNGGFSSNAGGSGLVVVRVRT